MNKRDVFFVGHDNCLPKFLVFGNFNYIGTKLIESVFFSVGSFFVVPVLLIFWNDSGKFNPFLKVTVFSTLY